MRDFAACTLIVVLLCCACSTPGRVSPTARASLSGRFPNVALTTHEGKKVRFYDDLIKDKLVLISFMFTGCEGVCPRATANVAKVRKALGSKLGRDVFLYSITLDPKNDSPVVLSRYARSIGAGPDWTFLTGKPSDIELLRRRLGVFDPDPKVDADRTQHGALLLYGSEASGKWSMMPALADPELIAGAILRLLR
jgi:protein SCO1/2